MEQVSRDQYQQALGELSARSSKLNGDGRALHGNTIDRFVAQLEAQLGLSNPEQAERIEKLQAQVLELQEALKAPPELEKARAEIEQLKKAAAEKDRIKQPLILHELLKI